MSGAAPDRLLAIMIKAPRPGYVKTRLTSMYGAAPVVALYCALIEDTIELARALPVPIVAICPQGDAHELACWLPSDVEIVPQSGRGLAAGLAFTFDHLCTPERRRVIAFNGDGPHLPRDVLDAAFSALSDADVVIGPCNDGGYYLVGATQPHPGLFNADAMGTQSALKALVARTGQLRLVTTLTPEHYDVDIPADVERLARDLECDPSRAPRTAACLRSWPTARG
jgi:rSAM/selenodomain-associated transferase 1